MNKLLLFAGILSICLISCNPGNQNSEKNIAIVEGYVNAVQKLDYDLMDNFLSDDYLGFGPSVMDSVNKATAVTQWKSNVEMIYDKIEYKQSRSLAVTVPDGENQGDWVSNWANLEITFKGTGEQVTIMANTVYKIENDKISRTYTFYNEADALEQMGYIFFNPENL